MNENTGMGLDKRLFLPVPFQTKKRRTQTNCICTAAGLLFAGFLLIPCIFFVYDPKFGMIYDLYIGKSLIYCP